MAEINQLETKKTIFLKINKSISWFFDKNQENRQTLSQTNQETGRLYLNKQNQ